jgi:hypothetical protein
MTPLEPRKVAMAMIRARKLLRESDSDEYYPDNQQIADWLDLDVSTVNQLEWTGK